MPESAVRVAESEAIEAGSSQAFKARQRLRELILAGNFPAGARITELSLVERLGMSRTPIRAALMQLKQECLLEPLSGAGHAVRTFSEREVADAIDLRGSLEGLADRLAAERGVRSVLLKPASQCLDRVDQLLQQETSDDDSSSGYVRLNGQFHKLLSQMVDSDLLAREIERASRLPFAWASGFVGGQARRPNARDMLVVAQHQRRQVLKAITQREAGRAQALMREHSRLARHNLVRVMQDPQQTGMPAVQPIRIKA
jgi:GntR family transcriptional regulator of vanillate catabolism